MSEFLGFLRIHIKVGAHKLGPWCERNSETRVKKRVQPPGSFFFFFFFFFSLTVGSDVIQYCMNLW